MTPSHKGEKTRTWFGRTDTAFIVGVFRFDHGEEECVPNNIVPPVEGLQAVSRGEPAHFCRLASGEMGAMHTPTQP